MRVEQTSADFSNLNRTESYFFWLAVVVLFACFAGQLWFHATRTSATVDEPDHILAGHRHWCGDFGINPEHPPLLKLLATAPLYFRELSEPPWECGSKLTSKFDAFSYGSTFLVENGIDSVVVSSRMSASLMSILFALLVFIAAWELFGRWEALIALAIVAFEPNLIAHGSIVTTDMAISATSFGAIYALYRYCREQTWARFLVVGVALGLMMATKHSAVVFVGILFALLIADAVLFRKKETPVVNQIIKRTAAYAAVFVIGMAILWSFYGFRYRAVPNNTGPTISVASYIKENGRPESVDSIPARATELISATRVFPESYVLGMADVIAWGTRNSWIFGRVYATGKWFYFPTAFVVKSSIALLFLLPLGLIFLYFTREKWREGMFLLVPAIIFFLFGLSSNFNTGARHILPIYGLLIVLAAAGAVWLCRKFHYLRYVLAVLLIYNAGAAVRTAPSYLAFANDLWGGYENTHRIFSDSNVETGQSMKLVTEYLAREGVQDCWIAGFVHPEMFQSVQPCRPMPSGIRIMVSRNLIDPLPPVIEGTVVLSVIEIPPRGGDEYVPITKSEPIAFIGGNTYVYRGRFEVPLAAAMSRVHRANHFRSVGDVDHAVDEAGISVELAPEDPRSHLALGQALLSTELKDEARRELEIAAELARVDSRFRNVEVWAHQGLEKLR